MKLVFWAIQNVQIEYAPNTITILYTNNIVVCILETNVTVILNNRISIPPHKFKIQ